MYRLDFELLDKLYVADTSFCDTKTDCVTGSGLGCQSSFNQGRKPLWISCLCWHPDKDELNCDYFLVIAGKPFSLDDFYIDNEQFYVERLRSEYNIYDVIPKSAKMTLKNMNRLYFGRKLGHKALEFVSTFNPVRLPISAGPEAFEFGADGKSPSLGYQKISFRLFV